LEDLMKKKLLIFSIFELSRGVAIQLPMSRSLL
jgi:hypothetical protein